MKYNFYGWENADVSPVDAKYSRIKNPREMYDLMSQIWCAETCAPRMRDRWTRENQTLGQCSITAFLAQDIFGGEVYGILRDGGNYHCYNVIGDCVFDLTSEQFGDEKLCYEGNPQQFREVHFAKEEKRLRYEYIKSELEKILATYYKAVEICEEDYGCEGVPENSEPMCSVLVTDGNENEKILKLSDRFLTENKIDTGVFFTISSSKL